MNNQRLKPLVISLPVFFLAVACGGGTYTIPDGSDPCSFTDVEDDGFAVTRSGSFQSRLHGVTGLGEVALSSSDAGVRMMVAVEIPNVHEYSMPPGTLVEVRMSSGERVSIESAGDALPESGVDYTGIFTRWELDMSVTPGLLEDLGASGWEALRLTESANNVFTMEIGASDSRTMQGTAQCLAR